MAVEFSIGVETDKVSVADQLLLEEESAHNIPKSKLIITFVFMIY